uniref:Uncharacterized protein n=1 Tax=Anguilla anguilla TaxID=7936 RepID=A0A0E9RJP8_ANGAN
MPSKFGRVHVSVHALCKFGRAPGIPC